MNDEKKTKQQLIVELEKLRRRVAELEGGYGGGEAQERRKPYDGTCQADGITGRSKVEQERDRLQNMLAAAIECLPFSFWVLDAQGRYALANAASRTLWGEFVGQRPADVAGDEQRLSAWLDNHRRAWAGEKVENEAEFTVGGEARSFHNVIAPIRMGEHIIGILGFNIDITERKQMEAALRESEERFQAFVDNAPTVAWMKDEHGRYVYLSKTFERRFAGRCEDWLGRTDFEHWPKELAEKYRKHDMTVLASGQVLEVMAENVSVDGAVSCWWTFKFPIRYASGKVCVGGVAVEVTQQRRAEAALRESEGRYRALAESTSDIIYILDRQGMFLYVNQASSQYTGVGPSEIIGKQQADIFPPEIAQVHVEMTRRVFATGEMFEEDQMFHFGPEQVWLRVHLLPIRDDAGQVTSVMGVCHNITERKRAEKALQEAHDKLEEKVKKRTAELSIFRRFAEASGRGFGMADLNGRISYVNPTLCRMFGEEKPEDVIGKDVSTYYTQEDKQKMADEIIPAVLRDGSWQGEQVVRPRHGTLTPTFQNSFLIQDENGKPFRFGVAMADISELKRAEAALRASEERFELAVRAAGVGIWDWDIRTGKVFYSPRWKMVLGCDDNEIGAGVDDWASRLHPDEREWVIKAQDEFFAGTSMTASAEYRLRHKDGSYRWIIEHVLVVRDEHGKACRLVGSHGDITDRKLAEAAVERERQSLWRMLQASDHERRIISYEIHDGMAQYLAAAGMQFQRYEALREKFPAKAHKAHETAVELVRQSYLEARRLISEVRPPIIDEIGLEMGISHLVHEQGRQGGPQIHFESNVQFKRLTPILENALYRIAQEALTNACKHSQSKKVTVSLSQESQEVCLNVQDWGIGFDPESVGKGHFGVEGIRQRVRLLGGRLTIESKPGHGTLVQVAVPILEKRSEE